MNRIFLSHSSVDKDFIRPIFNYFGSNRCIFDEMTFECGMRTLKEIFEGVEKSDIFVFFISNNSLNSEWVQKELVYAETHLNNEQNKLQQIFPIIIDDTIKYNDSRIPAFLNSGFGAYNLRHISNHKIACKKIDAQLLKMQMQYDTNFEKRNHYFYGRETEIKQFKQSFDQRDEHGKIRNIKCMIVSGIDGIGRFSYARNALISAELIEHYYFPMLLSTSQSDSIETLIINLCELGLGPYSNEDINSLGNMEQKIEILAELFKNAQKYQEIIFIQDSLCLVKSSGICYWLEKALELIENQITLVITTNITLNQFQFQRKKNIFSISLQNLDRTDTFGCLRGYSKSQNLPFSETDIDFFTQILTGYPPQIRYCVDLALAEKSIEFVKSNSYLIAEFPTANSAKMLNLVIEDECRSEYNNILTLLSQMNPTPLSFIHEIAQLNPIYDDILRKLRTFSICSFSGASGEYVKINTMIGDYILRSSFELSEEIKQIINNKIAVFSQNINNKDYMQYLAFPEFNFYVKEQLKKKETLPTRFLYSTVYVQSIVELYNKAQYIQVINLVKDMKDSGLFENSEKDTQSIIQFYYCSSLARRKSIEFESEVSFFADSDSYLSYNFLKGFNYRIQGKFQFAENSYLKVLERNPKHDKARRELVQLYINMQDYDIAYDLSKQNYNEYPDNIYQMQAYFDCLIHKLPLDSFQLQDVHDIIKNAENIYKTNATDIYFQLKAKYYAFIEKEKSEAIKIINEGLKKYPKSFYLCKDLFDIYRKYEDIHGMEIAFSQLSSIPNEGNANFNIALKCREAYLKAYKGVSPIAIGLSLKSSSNYLTDCK